eukprot:2823974-Ditylum_brightwellii.AAC.1
MFDYEENNATSNLLNDFMQQDGANTSNTSNPHTILNPIPEDSDPPSNVRPPKRKADKMSSQPTHC